MKKISIVIRTKDEERWISQCLRSILAQNISNPIEVVIVDNNSSDKTIAKAKTIWPEVIITSIDEYLPGKALNIGFKSCTGDYIVCLSAHCIPSNRNWLFNLIQHLDKPDVAGVYGRQIPTSASSAIDKRDLFITFGLDRKIQKRDSFFHNANSALSRDIWEKFPFDDTVTNIEDRIWGQDVIEAGLVLVYEPDACVYHEHGIHQNNQAQRVKSIASVINTNIDSFLGPSIHKEPCKTEYCLAIIPLRSTNNQLTNSIELIRNTITAAKESDLINYIVVTADTHEYDQTVLSLGIDEIIYRPRSLSAPSVRSDKVMAFVLNQLEDKNYFCDVVVPLEIIYPFRPKGLIDSVISYLVDSEYDSVITGCCEYRPCWQTINGQNIALNDFSQSRDDRTPILIGLPSLGCAVYPSVLRKGSRIGSNLGIYQISDPLAAIEIRTESQAKTVFSKI